MNRHIASAMPPDDASRLDPSYHHVQGLARGLAVLCELNRSRAGTASVIELAQLTRLHRSTVKRLLETLRATGFVHLLQDGRNYGLTYRVQRLSEGFNDQGDLRALAAPPMQALTERVLWPSDLVTLERGRMVIRHSTHAFSPLSFHPGSIGDNFPLLPTAAGYAYLAYCPAAERELLLEQLRLRDDAQGELARDQRLVSRILAETRQRGYAVNDGNWSPEARFGALAAPIRIGRHLAACLLIVFSKRTTSTASAMVRYGSELLATAALIERRGAGMSKRRRS